jgi:ribosomal protein S18 acetylase RimI-like enzyme
MRIEKVMHMMEAIIRDMDDADREAVIDLIWQLNRFEAKLSHDRATDRVAAVACLKVNDAKIREHGGRHLVALRDGVVAAYACGGVVEGDPYIKPEWRRYGYIFELVVAEGQRGSGLGSALVCELEYYFQSMELKSIGIGVLARNVRAAELYDRLGYKPHAVERVKWLDGTS